jgi:hypothetical protein
MKLIIKHQASYSRGQLLLRTLFGFFYIMIPHYFMMFFCMIYAAFLSFFAWWAILFTGRYPKSFFNYQVGMLRWTIRLEARLGNLADGDISFFPSGQDDRTSLEVPYPEKMSRGGLLVRTFFGILYIFIPHAFCLFFRSLLGGLLRFFAWWVILITGTYPEWMHAYQVGTIRWQIRLNLILSNLSEEYPKFSGEE